MRFGAASRSNPPHSSEPRSTRVCRSEHSKDCANSPCPPPSLCRLSIFKLQNPADAYLFLRAAIPVPLRRSFASRYILMNMVRPERRDVLADERSVRVSAGAPGSRLQAGGEIRPCEAECQKPLKERGARKRAATLSERCSHVIVSAERCLKGPSRSCRGEGNRQHSDRKDAGPSGVAGGGTPKKIAEQERPYPAASRAKTGHIRPEGESAEPGGSPRGS